MENKYYTPELEEFHFGFEFECLDQYGWEKMIFGESKFHNPELDQYDEYFNKLAHAITRVKYLDKLDIESLGWKPFDTNDKIEYKGFIGIKEMFYATFHPLGKLILAKKYDRVSIYHPDYIRDGSGRFDGYATLVSNLLIKNISELRKLMKQLGIN